MTFEDLINNCAKTPEDMRGYGFPKNVTDAFLLTADEVHSVVMSRVPGKAATTLVDEGYDLKGMYIKAKSCDWGPMAGFVCELPPFNKKGAGGIEFNETKIEEYKKKIPEINGSPVPAINPYTHLKISDYRKNEIFGNRGIAGELHIANVENDGNRIKGYACSADEGTTVLMQFLLKKKGDLWALYHGKIFTKKGTGYFEQYNKIRAGEEKNESPWGEGRYNNVVFADHSSIYPIRGLLNPYPPSYDQQGKEETPNFSKDAVAGDYDLFAVWPLIKGELERATEALSEDIKLDGAVTPYFAHANNKKLSVYSVNQRNVYIEFVPDEVENEGLTKKNFKSEEKKRQQEILKESGNINNIIYTTAQMLNSFVQSIYKSKIPNRVFHGDEGGRPGVAEIDYPFAVFLPLVFHNMGQRLLKEREFSGILLIESHEQFVTLINMLKDSCYVLLNYGWLVHLFQANDIDNFKDGLKKILFGDRENMDGALETIRSRLQDVDPSHRREKFKRSEDKIKHFMKPYE